MKCPICKKPADLSPRNRFRPFCSERCQMIDLGTWASGDYKVEGSTDTRRQRASRRSEKAQAAQLTGEAPPRIHPTSVMGPEVELAAGVDIGPLCLLDGKIRIGARTRLMATSRSSATLNRRRQRDSSGRSNWRRASGSHVHRRRALGEIGAATSFANFTVHRGSEHGDITIMGDDNFMMQNAHVAHDCRIGNSTIIAGGALLAGWVELGDRALVSGNCVVHQYTRIGRLAMMRGLPAPAATSRHSA